MARARSLRETTQRRCCCWPESRELRSIPTQRASRGERRTRAPMHEAALPATSRSMQADRPALRRIGRAESRTGFARQSSSTKNRKYDAHKHGAQSELCLYTRGGNAENGAVKVIDQYRSRHQAKHSEAHTTEA